MSLKTKIIAICWVLSIALTAYITYTYQNGKFAQTENERQQQYNAQLTEKIEQYKQTQEKLAKEAALKVKNLQDKNTDLEKRWSEAIVEKNALKDKYLNLVKNGWILKDPKSACILSEDTVKFLYELASDAHLVVEQLKITQEYALNLYDVCNAGDD